jgi:hypothetical protein
MSRCAAVVIAAAGAVTAPPLQAQPTAVAAAPVVALSSRNEIYRARIEFAAAESIARYREWLGPGAQAGVVIDDRTGRVEVPPTAARVALDLPWRSAPASMDVESQVAYGLARAWWPEWMTTGELAPIGDGLAWYLQSRVIERLFDFTFHVPGHSAEGVRFFGDAIPWGFRSITLGRWTAGLGRGEFLRATQIGKWPQPARRLPPGFNATTAQGGLAFGTLERMLGWPALESALRALAIRASAGVMTRVQVEQTIAAAVGQPLSWFFSDAFDGSRRLDYAVAGVSTTRVATPCPDGPCYHTEATVVRRGNVAFTGTDRLPLGEYEAGDALELRVTFADAQVSSVRWDGRLESKTFAFDSPAPAVTVELDPESILLSDANKLDDAWTTRTTTTVPLKKWVAWWLIWLQNAALSYGALF